MWLFLNTCLTATARGHWDYWIEIILMTLALAGIWWQTGEDHGQRQRTREGNAFGKDQPIEEGRQ
jgi:hypothetical protein